MLPAVLVTAVLSHEIYHCFFFIECELAMLTGKFLLSSLVQSVRDYERAIVCEARHVVTSLNLFDPDSVNVEHELTLQNEQVISSSAPEALNVFYVDLPILVQIHEVSDILNPILY